MSESYKTGKKVTRRDAIKLLGAAAGATILASLPSKWSKPELISSVLPVHAQTSSLGLSILSCNLSLNIITGVWSSSPVVGPMPIPVTSIPMQFTITFVNTHFVSGSDPQSPNPYVNNWNLNPPTGTVLYVNSSNSTLPGLMAADAGAASGSISILWEFLDQTHGSGSCSQTLNWSLLPIVDTISITGHPIGAPQADFSGEVIADGGSPVTARGFVWGTTPNPTLANNVITVGSGTGTFSILNQPATPWSVNLYGRAYATNAFGTSYGDEIIFQTVICLAEGTQISLADGHTKKIEDINYSDLLRVWNFDEGKFDSAHPLWIKKAEVTGRYNLLEFSDGSSLKTINQHRIFNKELGAFTYPMTEDTPIGTTTFNIKGQEVTLVKKSIVEEQVNYYNVITDHHLNLFADGILTSCRYNNIYPIVDMKFVKDERVLRSQEEYGLEDKYYLGLRLAEQTIPVAETIAYVKRLKVREVETERAAA